MPQLHTDTIKLVPLLLVAACSAAPAEEGTDGAELDAFASLDSQSAFTHTEHTQAELDTVVFVQCANAGAGDHIQITGTIEFLLHFTVDATGSFHHKGQGRWADVSATGLDTGNTYHVSRLMHLITNDVTATVQTYSETFHIVGPGPGNNYRAQLLLHATVNANGEQVVFVDNVTVRCH